VTGADIDLADLWRRTLLALESAGVSPSERAFVGFARLMAVIEQTALIAVPNDYTKKVLESDVRENLVRALGDSLGREIGLAVTVDPSLEQSIHEQSNTGQSISEHGSTNTSHGGPYPGERSDGPDATLDAARLERFHPTGDGGTGDGDSGDGGSSGTGGGGRHTPGVIPFPRRDADPDRSRLNPKYTFDTFVAGSSNRFAHAAANAVSEAPAKATTRCSSMAPLDWARPTCCTRSVTTSAQTSTPHVRVRYVNSEEFTNDFINSIRDDRASTFQSLYRDVDVLLIDDIQFLAGKVQTQEEFFHTFNALHNNSKQVVITSDLPPKQLTGFEERLRSRFEWGLITDVQAPDLETRIAILRKKAIQERMNAPDEVLEYIATR
jgi:chromosomal replication initiator protein